MADQLDDDKRVQQARLEELRERASTWALVISFLVIPGLAGLLFWWPLMSWGGPEVAAPVAVLVQIACLLTLKDRIADLVLSLLVRFDRH